MVIHVEQIRLGELGDDKRHRYFGGIWLKGMYLATRGGDPGLAPEVWIEWKISPSTGGVYLWEWQQLPGPECFKRASTLAQLLSPDEKPKELRVPQCLGFFDGRQYDDRQEPQDGRKVVPEKLAFVYAMFDFAEPDSQPRSLRQMIGDRAIPKPSATELVALAQALAGSLPFLHTVEWFGESLRSDNVIFFPKSNVDINYSEPIRCGFDYDQPKEVAIREFHTMPARDDADTQIYLHSDTSRFSQAVPQEL